MKKYNATTEKFEAFTKPEPSKQDVRMQILIDKKIPFVISPEGLFIDDAIAEDATK